MRVVGLSLLALVATLQPAGASEYPETKIGGWLLNGNNNVCTAGLRTGDMILVLVSADGDNDGGIAILTPQPTGGDGTPVELDFRVGGRRETIKAQYTANPDGYWIPFGMSSAMTRLPDDATLEVSDHGKALIAAPLGPIGKVVATLRDCDAQLARKSST